MHLLFVDIDNLQQPTERDLVTSESPEETALIPYFQMSLERPRHTHCEDLNWAYPKSLHLPSSGSHEQTLRATTYGALDCGHQLDQAPTDIRCGQGRFSD